MARTRKARANLIKASAGSAAPLAHASVGPAAPLVTAHTGGVGGGASMVSAPTPRGFRSWSGATTSPGGFKKSGLDAASRARAEGVVTNQSEGSNTAKIFSDGSAEFGFGNVRQKLSPQQVKWILGRGSTGATMSARDQAVYDRFMQIRRSNAEEEKRQIDLRNANAEDERKRKLDAAEWDRQNAVRTKQAQDAQIAEEKRRNKEYDRRTKAEQDYKAQQQKAALDAENAKYEALNKKYGIAEGTRLSDKDYGDLEAGRSKWGYSREDQGEIDKINSEMDAARRSGKFSTDANKPVFGKYNKVDENGNTIGMTELEYAEAEAADKIAGFKKRLLPNDQPQTAEQIYNGSFAAPDGTRLIANGSGGLVAIPGTGPQKEVETPEQKQANALEKERRAYVLKQIEDARKSWNSVDEQIDDPRGSNYPQIRNPNYGKPFDPTEAIKAANANFTSVIGGNLAQSVPAPNPQGDGATQTQTQENDWRKALGW